MRKSILHIVIFVFLFCACKNNTKGVSGEVIAMELSTETSRLDVGNELALTIKNKDDYMGPASLIVNTNYSNSKINLQIKGKQQKLKVPAQFSTELGIVNYYLLVQGQRVAATQIEILSGSIADPIEVFAGPNTIWVNDLQASMVVALPKDQYSNPVADGALVSYGLRMPSTERSSTDVAVSKQVAPFILSSKDQMGEAYVGIAAEGASAKEQKIQVISLWPREVIVKMETVLPYADSREFMRVKTAMMRDKNGDIIPDGTHVLFRAEMSGERSKYNAYSIDGVASCYIRNPDRSGRMMIDAVVGSRVVSNTLSQDFKSNVKSLEYQWGGSKLEIGPITSFLGQYVPDGTKVVLSYNNQKQVKETEDGKLVFNLSDEVDKVTISINDFKRQIIKTN